MRKNYQIVNFSAISSTSNKIEQEIKSQITKYLKTFGPKPTSPITTCISRLGQKAVSKSKSKRKMQNAFGHATTLRHIQTALPLSTLDDTSILRR